MTLKTATTETEYLHLNSQFVGAIKADVPGLRGMILSHAEDYGKEGRNIIIKIFSPDFENYLYVIGAENSIWWIGGVNCDDRVVGDNHVIVPCSPGDPCALAQNIAAVFFMYDAMIKSVEGKCIIPM